MTEKTNQEVERETDALPEKLFEEAKTTPSYESLEAKPSTITVKYNGEEKQISLEEAVVLAQKGMNYDHVVAERDSKYKRELDVLERYAAMSGMSRDEYVRRLEEEESAAASGEDWRGMQELYSVYPELRQQGVPDDVSEAIRQGENPLRAYQNHRISELTRELENQERLERVRARAIGSVRGDATERVRDAFLEGFIF